MTAICRRNAARRVGDIGIFECGLLRRPSVAAVSLSLFFNVEAANRRRMAATERSSRASCSTCSAFTYAVRSANRNDLRQDIDLAPERAGNFPFFDLGIRAPQRSVRLSEQCRADAQVGQICTSARRQMPLSTAPEQ